MMSSDHSHQWQRQEQKEEEKEGKEPAAKKAKTDLLAVTEEKRKAAIKELTARLEEHDENRKTEQEKLHNECNELRRQIDAMEDSLNSNLEKIFKAEDNRLQNTLTKLRELNVTEEDKGSIATLKGAIQMARQNLQ